MTDYTAVNILCSSMLQLLGQRRDLVSGSRTMENYECLRRYNQRLVDGQNLTDRQLKVLECMAKDYGLIVGQCNSPRNVL